MWASPASATIIFLLDVIEETTQRITEVAVNDVEGVTGNFTAPDPFSAPLLADPIQAQNLAFNDLGVPLGATGLMTSFDDVGDFVMMSDLVRDLSVGPGFVFVGGLTEFTPAFDSILPTLQPGVPQEFDDFFFLNDFGVFVISGSVQIRGTRTDTIVDAFRMNISQDDVVTVPETNIVSLFGIGLLGLGWARRKIVT